MAASALTKDASEGESQLKQDEERKTSCAKARGDDGAPSNATTLGLVLKILRELSGVSRAELAAGIGVGENHLREIEAGRETATIPIVHRIAAALMINASVIMFFSEDEELVRSFRPGSKVKPLQFRLRLLQMLHRMDRR